MKFTITAGLLVVALVALYVRPSLSSPTPEPEPEPKDCKGKGGKGGSGGGKGGSGGGKGGSGGSNKHCYMERMGVDMGLLGGLLNGLVSLLVELLFGHDDACKKQQVMGKMSSHMDDMKKYMNGMSGHGKKMMEGLLTPLLEAVENLLKELLGSEGVLGAVDDLLSDVLNLVICLLQLLGIDLNLDLMLKLGNILNLDLAAILNLG